MSKTLTVTTTVTLSGDGWGGSPLFTESLQNTAAGLPDIVNLINGNTTVTVPATALGVLLVPPPTSTVTKTLKGIAGDTGVPLAPASSSRVMFSAAGAVASIVINANGTESIEAIWL